MTIKELITRLLDEPMDSEIVLHIAEEHTDSHVGKVEGYFFYIDKVERWTNNMTFLTFTDWRKTTGDE